MVLTDTATATRFAREFDSSRYGLPPPRDAENDQFLWPTFFWLAVILPGWFFYELTLASLYGVNYHRILLYNAVRLGPMYCNFMYVYVLAHKEAHLMKGPGGIGRELVSARRWVSLG